MNQLTSNKDLYDYLMALEARLKKEGMQCLADCVDFAIKNAASTGTEFLGESRIALRHVLDQGSDVLSEEELLEISDVVKQIDAALDRRE